MRRFWKMDTKISRVHQKLDSIIKYLKPLMPLANCHMVEFITQNHWQKLMPNVLTDSIQCMDFDDAVEKFWMSAEDLNHELGPTELDKWIKKSRSHYITANNDFCLSKEQLRDRITAWGGTVKPEIKVKEFMNSKKSYEVQTMCGLVASLHEASNSTCCLEAGGGRGPLLAALSLSYGVPSLTVDCNENAVSAAQKRSGIMKKQWHAIAKRLDGSDACTMNKEANLHRFASAFVTYNTDLVDITKKCFPEYTDRDVKLLLTGLHTCGNLGPDSLRIFAQQPSVAAVFNVPCCYHLLTEHVDVELCDAFYKDFETEANSAGFPMSQYLKGMNLGRNARMLAAQSIDRVVNLRQLPAKSLIYRALLQVVIKDHLPSAVLSEGRLKRMSKCENFEQYFKMADSILHLNLFDTLPESYLLELNKNMDIYWKKMVLFYLLRLCLAQVIESVILLDRLLFLMENGFDKVFLVKLFDPILSPRCHSIVAIR